MASVPVLFYTLLHVTETFDEHVEIVDAERIEQVINLEQIQEFRQ